MSFNSLKLSNASLPSALRFPPRTRSLPLIGALPAFLSQPFAFLREAREHHGDIYTLDLGVVKWVVLNHPRHIEHVMRDNVQNYRKGEALLEAIRPIAGNGLLLTEGEPWLRRRRMMQPQFHRQRLAALAEAMAETTANCLQSWANAAQSGRPMDMLDSFPAIAMKVMLRALFGQALSNADIDRASQLATHAVDYLICGALFHSLPRWLPAPGARNYLQAVRELDDIVLKLVAQERQAATPSDSLLGMLLQMVDDETGETLTDTQLRDEVVTFFIAGYETISMALTWTSYFLTRYPEVMRKLQNEVDTVLGDRPPTFADLGALPYARMVVQEAMRLRPPSWWLPRTAIADDQIDGYTIPAGTTVVLSIYGVHHHPQFWENPDCFDPERFRPERMAQQHKMAWMPFGAGQRQCIGKEFSLMEAQIILAMIAQRYTLQAASSQPIEPKLGTMLKPQGKVLVRLDPRVAETLEACSVNA